MAHKFYSLLVARATAFWYCKILSVLCLYDMGHITQQETISRIARILRRRENCGARVRLGILSSLADWHYLRKKAHEAYFRRGFGGCKEKHVRKCM